jgi:hypothetical protein
MNLDDPSDINAAEYLKEWSLRHVSPGRWYGYVLGKNIYPKGFTAHVEAATQMDSLLDTMHPKEPDCLVICAGYHRVSGSTHPRGTMAPVPAVVPVVGSVSVPGPVSVSVCVPEGSSVTQVAAELA